MEEPDSGRTAARERLALLYQGVLTAIVRIQTGKEVLTEPDGFQKRMEAVLNEVEREAAKVGYAALDIRDAHYAVVAFLDETIQRSSDPNRHHWRSLQAKLYAQALAGEGFYERLKAIRTRRDSPNLADLLEVYYLCLLLDYRGRYALEGRAELENIMEDLKDRIAKIRPPQPALSPEGTVPPGSKPIAPSRGWETRWKLITLASLSIAVVSWGVLRLLIGSFGQTAVDAIRTMPVP